MSNHFQDCTHLHGHPCTPDDIIPQNNEYCFSRCQMLHTVQHCIPRMCRSSTQAAAVLWQMPWPPIYWCPIKPVTPMPKRQQPPPLPLLVWSLARQVSSCKSADAHNPSFSDVQCYLDSCPEKTVHYVGQALGMLARSRLPLAGWHAVHGHPVCMQGLSRNSQNYACACK